jgi:anthraniloyl-CoA monooxygenase
MKVTIIGAGPSGLYLAILLRKADHEITVLERNAPDATFGWGVVFSEETLGTLRDADPATHLDITDSFARWSTVDIRYHGKLLRSRGHTFSAIARKHLLSILQQRAKNLGAHLEFGVEVDALDFPDTDLIVAADGANSRVRNRDAKTFRATVSPQGCKYVWFGTDLVLDSFTFSFKETEFGLFQAHAYPFDEYTSTWIVECAEPVWRKASLDTMSEADSIAFCESLFADDLAGHKLMSNRSLWLDFPLVRCAQWHHGNTVLLGDAAHTAHFSIGSGTKLAMEDAISLATALTRHHTLDDALTEYELDRQPTVERFQEAATESAAYFARTATYTSFEPLQFAFNLLTRSGRVTHTNLTQRDPDLIRDLDSWFTNGSDALPGSVAAPPLFAPLHRNSTRLPNRLVAEDPDDPVQAARAGAGLILTGPVTVNPQGRVHPDTPVLDSANDWAAIADKIHANGALLGLRLTHAGPRGATRHPAQGRDIRLPAAESWPLIAASALPYAPYGQTPKSMDANDLAAIRQAFTDATKHAVRAGIDILELDMADGHLLASFLSPLTNHRTDEWGGANRWPYPLTVLDEVRDTWPHLLAVRLTVTDWFPRGQRLQDGIDLAKLLKAHGTNLIHISAGHTTAESRPTYRRAYLTTLSDQIRNQAKIPTLVGGYLTTPDEINTILAAGRADLCVLHNLGHSHD